MNHQAGLGRRAFGFSSYFRLRREHNEFAGTSGIRAGSRRLRLETLENRLVLTTIQVVPVADAFTQDNNRDGSVEFVVDSSELQTQNFPLANAELRSELEFDLSSIVIPPTEAILAAHLAAKTSVFGNPTLTIYGYTGDGVITAADHAETGLQIGMEMNIATPTAEFDLASNFVGGFVGSTDKLGVLLTTDTDAVNISSSETADPPVLVITTALITEVADERIDAMIDDVDGLESDGTLNKGNANALRAKLEGAKKKIAKGQNDPAINKLEAFINQVSAFENSGRLTNVEAQNLIDQAEEVISLLEGSPLIASSYLSGDHITATAMLSQSDLLPIVSQAKSYWVSAGTDSQMLNRLDSINVQVADLPGPFLGFATSDSIRIDIDGAGHGWRFGSGQLSTGSLDLLSAVTHELGHVLGFEHDDHGAVMRPELSTGLSVSPGLAMVEFSSRTTVANPLDGPLDSVLRSAVRDLAIRHMFDDSFNHGRQWTDRKDGAIGDSDRSARRQAQRSRSAGLHGQEELTEAEWQDHLIMFAE